MKDIGKKLKNLRKAKGLNQEEVADAAGIKQSSYANIENGKTKNITIQVGLGLAKVLNVDFIELFEIPNTKDSIVELKSEVRKLKNDLELYRDMLDFLKVNHMIQAPLEPVKMEDYVFIGQLSDEENLDQMEKDRKVNEHFYIGLKQRPSLFNYVSESVGNGWLKQMINEEEGENTGE